MKLTTFEILETIRHNVMLEIARRQGECTLIMAEHDDNCPAKRWQGACYRKECCSCEARDVAYTMIDEEGTLGPGRVLARAGELVQ
jgi:hypothetical protein